MIYQLNGSRKTMASMSESCRANPLAILPIPMTACTAGSGSSSRSMKTIKSCRFWNVAEVANILSLDFAITPSRPTRVYPTRGLYSNFAVEHFIYNIINPSHSKGQKQRPSVLQGGSFDG